MKPVPPPFLIDVSRLVRRLKKGFLPTGIDRVILKYVEQYGPRSRAIVRNGCYYSVLPQKDSRQLFCRLLSRSTGVRSNPIRSLLSGLVTSICPPDMGGAVLFNIGHSGLEGRRYQELLRRMNVRPVFMAHDLIPIIHPEFSRPGEREKHLSRMRAVLELAHGVITNSRATLDELASFAREENMQTPPSVAALLATSGFCPNTAPALSQRPYFVILGTIEPRKNHLLLLQIWKRLVERMGNEAPMLVIIGRIGWECENVLDLLERCELLRNHVLVLSSCSDTDMVTWLRHSRALLFPSFAEGFGLPLVEALELGVPVIASNLPVFREIAGDIPEYLDPLDAMGWLDMIVGYTDPESGVRENQIRRMAGFAAPTWEHHFRQVDSLLERVVRQ